MNWLCTCWFTEELALMLWLALTSLFGFLEFLSFLPFLLFFDFPLLAIVDKADSGRLRSDRGWVGESVEMSSGAVYV